MTGILCVNGLALTPVEVSGVKPGTCGGTGSCGGGCWPPTSMQNSLSAVDGWLLVDLGYWMHLMQHQDLHAQGTGDMVPA